MTKIIGITFGRPPKHGKPMKQVAIFLPDGMIEWLKKQPAGNMSETVRQLINSEMTKK